MRRVTVVAGLLLVAACSGGSTDDGVTTEVSDLPAELDASSVSTTTSSTTTAVGPPSTGPAQPIDLPGDDSTTLVPDGSLPDTGDGWFPDPATGIPCTVVRPGQGDSSATEVECYRLPAADAASEYCADARASDEAKLQQGYGEAVDAMRRAASAVAPGSDAEAWASTLADRLELGAVDMNEIEQAYGAVRYIEVACGFQWRSDPLQLGD